MGIKCMTVMQLWFAGLLMQFLRCGCKQSYNQKLLVVPSYKVLKSLDRLHVDEKENSMFRCPLWLLEQQFTKM